MIASIDTVSSADPGDGLAGRPYDVALKPLLKPVAQGALQPLLLSFHLSPDMLRPSFPSRASGGRAVAINGSVGRWAARLTGCEPAGFHLLMERDSGSQLAELAAWAAQGLLRVTLDGAGQARLTRAARRRSSGSGAVAQDRGAGGARARGPSCYCCSSPAAPSSG